MGWSSDGKEGGSDGKENAKDGGQDAGLYEEHEVLGPDGVEQGDVFTF